MQGVREVVGRPRYAQYGTLGPAMAMICSRASAAVRQARGLKRQRPYDVDNVAAMLAILRQAMVRARDDLARMARRQSVGPVVAARLEELFSGLAEYGLRLNYHGWRG